MGAISRKRVTKNSRRDTGASSLFARLAAWWKGIGGGAQATILAAVIVGAFGWLGAFSGDDGGDTTPPPSEAISPEQVEASPTPDLNESLEGLASDDIEIRLNAIANLRYTVVKGDPELREVVLGRLAQLIRGRGEQIPPGQDAYGYCVEGSTEKLAPNDVQAALDVIGDRPPQDTATPIDLNSTNISYTRWYGLNMRNVRFDNALMCRVLMADALLDGSTFLGSNLRWSYMNCTQGLIAEQLVAAGRLYGAHLPVVLAGSPELRSMIDDDPDWDPDPRRSPSEAPSECG